MEENQNMNEEQLNQGGEQQTPQQQAQQAQIDSIINKLNTPNPDPETQNLDVLLQDPKLQGEFDKKLEKAINKALKNKDQEYQKRDAALKASISTEKEKMRALRAMYSPSLVRPLLWAKQF